LRSTPSSLPFAAALVVLTPAVEASAQSNAAMAEQLFREGQQLLEQGRTHEACDKLGASQRLDPALGTLMNLAYCHELEGKTASAWSEYADAAAQAARAAERPREQFAREHAAALEPKLSRVRIDLPRGVGGVEIRLDGAPLPAALAGAEVPVDPGDHTVDASAAGKKPWRASLRIDPGAGVTVARVTLEDAGTPAGTAESPAPSRVPALAIGGAGALALCAGVVLVVRAYALDQKSQDEAGKARLFTPPDPAFASASIADHHAAVDNQTAGLITAGLGAAAMGVGAYLLFARPGERARVAPEVAPGRAAITLRGEF
jgi:hypothetical protein